MNKDSMEMAEKYESRNQVHSLVVRKMWSKTTMQNLFTLRVEKLRNGWVMVRSMRM